MILRIVFLGGLFLAFPFLSQGQAITNGPRKVTIYLSSAGQQLHTAAGSDHRAEITMRDSVSGMMREYYPSGKLWRIIPFANVGLGIRHGVAMSYDEAGKLRKREDYLAGHRQGEVQVYEADGTLSRTIVFDHDKRISQQCFTAAGQLKDCQVKKVLPQYPGGIEGLVADIEKAAVLPIEDVANKRFGTVVIKLIVDAHVNILGATAVDVGNTVLYPPSAAMQAAVIEAVGKIQRFTAPGEIDEQPTAVLYVLPIRLGQPASGNTIVWSSDKIVYHATATFLSED